MITPITPPEPVAVPEGTPAPIVHSVEEDPEDFLGEVILDPWADSAQADWANAPEILRSEVED